MLVIYANMQICDRSHILPKPANHIFFCIRWHF